MKEKTLFAFFKIDRKSFEMDHCLKTKKCLLSRKKKSNQRKMYSDEAKYGKKIEISTQEDLDSFIKQQQQDPSNPVTNVDVISVFGFGKDPDVVQISAAFGKNLKRIGLTLCRSLTDDGLQPLATATALQQLDLGNTNISDAGLIHLANLPALRVLLLNGCNNISDAELFHLAKVPSLQELFLNLCNTITDAGLVHVANIPALQLLHLNMTTVSDAGLVHLSKLSALQELNLNNTKVSDAGLVHLAKLSALQRLELSRTKISDAGLQHLAELSALQELTLSGTRISDAGLIHLAKLSSLRVLELGFCNTSDAGLQHLVNLPMLDPLKSNFGAKVTQQGFVDFIKKFVENHLAKKKAEEEAAKKKADDEHKEKEDEIVPSPISSAAVAVLQEDTQNAVLTGQAINEKQ